VQRFNIDIIKKRVVKHNICNKKTFDDLKNNRYSAEAAKTILRMKQERVKTDAIYHEIVERINALAIVEGDAAYAGFINEMKKSIEGYDNTIQIRRAKGKKTVETPAAN